MSPIRPVLRAILLSAAITIPAVAYSAPASATSITCPVVYWGSLPKVVAGSGPTESILNVRTGRHTCFDRLVVDIGGSGPAGYAVRYVDNVYSEAQPHLVRLAGGAKLQIIVRAPNYDVDTGLITYTPSDQWHSYHLTDLTGYRTFRQLAFAGSFEGQTTFGLGVRARLPMRAFVLGGPGAGQRLVIDVAHSWNQQ